MVREGKFFDDAVPHVHNNLHKPVLLGLARQAVSVFAMTCRKHKKHKWNNFSFLFFSFLPCTKPFWVVESWSTVYMTPRFPYILLLLRNRSRESTEKKKKKARKKSKPSCRVNWLLLALFFLPPLSPSMWCFPCLQHSCLTTFHPSIIVKVSLS